MSAYLVVAMIAALAILLAARSGAWTAADPAARLWAAARAGDLAATLAAERASVAARAGLAAWCLARSGHAPPAVRRHGIDAAHAWLAEAADVALLSGVEARLCARPGDLRATIAHALTRLLALLLRALPGTWAARGVDLVAALLLTPAIPDRPTATAAVEHAQALARAGAPLVDLLCAIELALDESIEPLPLTSRSSRCPRAVR